MSGIPIPVNERHKPFEKKSCARCLDDEFRIDGYCSIYCRDMAELEAEVEATNAALEINDNCISGVEDALEKCEAENERLREEVEQLRVEGARADDCVYDPGALGGES